MHGVGGPDRIAPWTNIKNKLKFTIFEGIVHIGFSMRSYFTRHARLRDYKIFSLSKCLNYIWDNEMLEQH